MMGRPRSCTVWRIAAWVLALLLLSRAATAEVRVWNYDVLDDALQREEAGELKAMRIVGTRNATFSGAVAVESATAIEGLRATVGPLTSKDGILPAENVQVRYAVAWENKWPGGLDILLEEPPAEVKVDGKRALVGVWVTVKFPRNAASSYRGQLTIKAEGSVAQQIPIELAAADWVVPETQDFRTWVEMIQSTDTAALEYKVPLWSDRHWEMIARSMELIGQTGSRVVYLPLISQTNQGNEQSMVRWIRKADGTWKHDYSILERYLDTAQKHMGKPKLVVLYVWDIYLSTKDKRPTVDEKAVPYAQEQQRLAQKRWDMQNKGMLVSVLDEATGKVKSEYLPHYTAEESRGPWSEVFREVRKRLKDRKLDDVVALGMVNDAQPSREDVVFLNEISGGLPWVAQRHPSQLRDRRPVGNKLLWGIADICYEAHVYNIRYQSNPDVRRMYGWQSPELRVFFGRNGIPNGAAIRVRLLPETNLTGDQRGIGRVGADYWYVIRNARGERAGSVYFRYPENMWRNLNIGCWLLAPGQKGPVATARHENLREGVQECEARIFLESVLTDAAKKSQIGDDLAARVQALLDERQRAIWRSVWNEEQLKMVDTLGIHGNARNEQEAVWQALESKGVKLPPFWEGAARQLRADEHRKGEAWFIRSGWQDRNRKLFDFAAEVAEKLAAK